VLGNWVIFLVVSLLSSIATFGNDHNYLEGVVLLIISAVTFLTGLTEAIVWAAHPVE
jgi:hypothetical protein